MRYKKNVGDLGEEFAANMLENSGFTILARNFSTKFGEIDIIAVKERTIHFIEVKTRTGVEFGYPSEAVTRYKREKIRKVANYYLNTRRFKWDDVSFDVYEVMTEMIENCM